MSGYGLFKEMSELDPSLLKKPKKYVSLRMNVFLCFLSGTISNLIPLDPRTPFEMQAAIAMYFVIYYILYAMASSLLNKDRNNGVLVDDDPPADDTEE